MRLCGPFCLSFILATSALAQQTLPEPHGTEKATPAGETDTSEGAGVEFRTVIGNKPLELALRPDQEITPAVEQFRRTGENPYAGEEGAMAEGKKIYARLCQSCHMPDGTGRMGPSLADNEWNHSRLDTEVGRFEIIYGGGAGAMQSFGQRLDQDEILKVMAYIDTFRG
jgi:cytochrome c-L